MTTPGGVPNLPATALTVDTLATQVQDMSDAAMRARANARFPSTFGTSTGGNPAVDLSPFGVILAMYAGTTSGIANADPADINGPEDLPGLFMDFIEGLPVIGQFVQLVEAIAGTYDGDDTTLLWIQGIFAPIRALLQSAANIISGIPTPDQIFAGWTGQVTTTQNTADLALNLVIGRAGSGLGTSGNDTFDGAALTDAGSNYSEVQWGSAANKWYINGAGKLQFSAGGFLGNNSLIVHATKGFIGDYQTTGVYIPKGIASTSEIILMNRFALFEGYCARINGNRIQLCWMETPSGTPIFHSLGSPFSYVQSNGEFWEFDVGEADLSNDYMLRVRRNNIEVAAYDDTAHNVAPSAGNRNIALCGGAASGIFGVIVPPPVDTFIFYERV